MASKAEKTEVTKEKPSEEKEEKEKQEVDSEEKQPAEGTEPKETAEKEKEQEEEAADTTEEKGGHETSAEKQKEPPKDDRSKRVYVGNLAWGVSWQDLKDHMKSTGLDVKMANILSTPDGRSKGCGIVEFATAEDAQQAVSTLNDTELKGRPIFVREDREERAAPPHQFSSGEQAKSRRVYVGNLSWDVAWQDLKDHMREAGEVLHAEVIREHTGRSKGCGIVEYATEEDAANAIATMTDTELKGRMIFVREDRETSSQTTPGRGQNSSVYVWNLSPETSWQDLKDHMRKAGNVDSATILTNTQGESMCCGVVVYQKPQEAARAIRELNNSELKGLPMYLREDRAQGGRGGAPGRGGGRGRGGRGRGSAGRSAGRGSGPTGEAGTQIYVGNLSPQTTWRELKDHFRQCGDVKHAEVKVNYQGESKGFGFVHFSNKQEADTAVSRLNGSELQGSALEVRIAPKTR